MALRNNNHNKTNADQAAGFEDFDDVAVADRPTEAQAAPSDPKERLKPAVISDATRRAQAFKKELEEMRDAVSFGHGVLPAFKATNGAIRETGSGTRSFGAWVQGRLMGYSPFWQVSPGGSESKLKGFVAFSNDGKIIDSVVGDGVERTYVGKTVAEYLDYLHKTEGLSDAGCKPYMNLAIYVVGSDKGEAAGLASGEVVNIVLSKTSMTSFTAYEEKLKLAARAAAMGLPTKAISEDPFMLRFEAEVANNNKGQSWTKLTIEPARV